MRDVFQVQGGRRVAAVLVGWSLVAALIALLPAQSAEPASQDALSLTDHR